MDCDNREELLNEKAKSYKRRRDDQDPTPPLKDYNQSKKKKHESDATGSKPTLAQTFSAYIPIPDDVHVSDSEDTDDAHLPKIKTRPDWLKLANALANSYQDPEENKLLRKTGDMGSFIKWYCRQIGKSKLSKADLEGPAFKVDLVNPKGRVVPDVSKPLPLGGPPGQTLGLKNSYRHYGLKVNVNTHWWFKRKEFYITRHSAPSDRHAVRSHMRILSIVSLKTYSRYGYTYLREIILRSADYKEYKILESNFKNMHLNDFEDTYLLHLQGKLNHLSRSNKVHLFNVVNLWIRNIVIRKRMEDLQLGVGSYQTKLKLTKPRWDAIDFLFKEDYTIVSKPRAIIYKDRTNKKKMMESELHKFSDGTLQRILEKLDVMVNDYVQGELRNWRDLPRDNLLVSVEVLRYDIKRSKSENKGIVPTEMELVLEQTQQGTSHDISVSTEGVEE
ncbi:hypothetical protein Tco_1409960 [Tanacetum coccineum]